MMQPRDPVENAFLAFTALSDADKAKMVQRFNEVFDNRCNAQRLIFEPKALDEAKERVSR